MFIEDDETYLRLAIALAEEAVGAGGGPFGAVIVHEGEIIARGQNRVVRDCDPTAHAEMQAIRMAAHALGRPHLHDCVLYASCEPCPMCLAASLWAHLPRIVHAATNEEASRAGFDDTPIALALYGAPRPAACPCLHHLPLAEARLPFDRWLAKADRVPY